MTEQDGQPLTRRQLRELERQRSGGTQPGAESSAPAAGSTETSAPASASTADSSSPTTSAPAEPAAPEHTHHAAPTPQPQTRRARYHGGIAYAIETEEVQTIPPAKQQPVEQEMPVVGTASDVSAEEAELAEVEDSPAAPVAPVTIERGADPLVSSTLPTSPERPAANKGEASFDDLIASRTIGTSNSISTTSALVLPNVPTHADVGSALDETGEVIITGSIDLPASLSSTGASPAAGLERSDLDALIEGADRDQTNSDVAPMAANRAVSTHGAPSAMVAPPKRARVNAPLILAITAGVLAVGVVGLLLAAFVFRIF